jgi:hypothetical protein
VQAAGATAAEWIAGYADNVSKAFAAIEEGK